LFFPVDERNVPDGLYQFGSATVTYPGNDGLALFAIGPADFYFHQFMMFQG
jgi:hypothetical protein